jgi:hypothetical protein
MFLKIHRVRTHEGVLTVKKKLGSLKLHLGVLLQKNFKLKECGSENFINKIKWFQVLYYSVICPLKKYQNVEVTHASVLQLNLFTLFRQEGTATVKSRI